MAPQESSQSGTVNDISRKPTSSREKNVSNNGSISKIKFKLADSEIKTMFDAIDTDKSGEISMDELASASQEGKLGFFHTDEACNDLMKKIDIDSSNSISLEEFYAFVREREKILSGIFDEINRHKTGCLSSDDLKQYLETVLMREITKEEEQALFDALDEDRNGQIEDSELRKGLLFTVGEGGRLFDFSLKSIAKFAKIKYSLQDSEIKSMFEKIDQDGNGSITLEELTAAAFQGKLGILHSEQACSEFMDKADQDKSDSISFNEFSKFIREREGELSAYFEGMDSAHQGHVDANQLQQYMTKILQREIPIEEAQKFINELDADKNGTVECSELVRGALLTVGSPKHIFDTWSHNTFFLHSDKKSSTPTPILKTLTSAFIAGAASRTAAAPFDRASILMGASGNLLQNSSSLTETIQAAIKSGGLRSLWIGNGINCLVVGPESAFLCYYYVSIKPYICKDEEHPTLAEKFVSGGVAGVLASTSVYPLQVAQARAALGETGGFRNLKEYFSTTFQQDGLKGLFRGYQAACLRSFPHKGLDLTAYISIQKTFLKPDQQPTLLQSMMFGVGASIISNLATAPLLTIRTKLMSQGACPLRPIVYSGVIDCAKKVVFGNASLNLRPQGVLGLYRGALANLIKNCPSCAFQYFVYEKTYELLPFDL